jgi:hypothetical protein
MTTSFERTRTLVEARVFLQDLLSDGKYPGVPAEVRSKADALLRHFPEQMDLRLLHSTLPMFYDPPGPSPKVGRPTSNHGR